MAVIAKLNNLRISPRKVRLVADMVRGKKANNAQAVLGFCIKKGALPMKKLLESAIANAKNNFKLEEKDLFISLIKVDEGRTMKRWRARARGRACRIEKKTSNITLAVDIFKDKTKKEVVVDNIKTDDIKEVKKAVVKKEVVKKKIVKNKSKK